MHGSPILLDGSYGEGGGALLRTALAMSALTQQPVRIGNVRGGTKFPGLTPEDLVIVRALAISCAAETVGAEPRSSEFSFLPTRRPRALKETLEAEAGDGTYGRPCVNVVLTALMPVLARTGAFSVLTSTGETHGHGVLSYDSFSNVTLAAYRAMGVYAYPDLIQAGFGRGSDGEVRLEIEPSAIQGLNWGSRGELMSLNGVVVTCGLESRIAERGVSHLEKLARHAGLELHVEAWSPAGSTPGAFVCIWGQYENGIGGATATGARGIRMESVVQQAFDEFLTWNKSGATMDAFIADQVLVALAIAETDSTFEVDRLTSRFLTCVWVIKQFLPIRITVKGQEGGPGVVMIRK